MKDFFVCASAATHGSGGVPGVQGDHHHERNMAAPDVQAEGRFRGSCEVVEEKKKKSARRPREAAYPTVPGAASSTTHRTASAGTDSWREGVSCGGWEEEEPGNCDLQN